MKMCIVLYDVSIDTLFGDLLPVKTKESALHLENISVMINNAI